MKKETIQLVCSIVALVVAFVGMFYTFMVDQRVRKVEKRGKAPFFKIVDIKLDSTQSYGDGSGGYYYPKKPNGLSYEYFMAMGESELRIPEDYPDNRVLGLVLKNTGVELRSPVNYTSKESIESMVFQEAGKNRYELRYVFRKATKGEKFKFTLNFETCEGDQGSQVWEVIKGVPLIKRVKPRMP